MTEREEKLFDTLDTIVMNAELVSDFAMGDLTDTYQVPLDDIEAAKALLKEIQQEEADGKA